MCTDSSAIKKITIRYRFPLPWMDDMMDWLSGSAHFSKIDLKSEYHQIEIQEGYEWKTTFKTNEGLYEWLVMPFGLSNAPTTFMRLMNEMMKEYIKKFVIVYLDNILVFSRTREEHLRHVRRVLEKLQQNKLLINLKKCTFLQKELIYLGFVIAENELNMDSEKIAVIVNWPSPKSLFESFTFVLKHISRQANNVADALSRRALLLQESTVQVLGFEHLKYLYQTDIDFKEAYEACQNPLVRGNSPWLDYNLQEKLFFRGG
eukprot:PITA_14944